MCDISPMPGRHGTFGEVWWFSPGASRSLQEHGTRLEFLRRVDRRGMIQNSKVSRNRRASQRSRDCTFRQVRA